MRLLSALLPSLLLAVGLACGNGSVHTEPTSGGGLTYLPPASDGWRLVQDEASTRERLVLALVGPAGTLTRGASITLLVDQNLATFAPFADGSYVQSTGQYVTTSMGKPEEPRSLQLLPASRMGNKLTVGIFQKDAAEPPKASDRPLFRIALTVVPGSAAGTPVSLVLRKACIIPDDMAAANFLPVAIPVALGRLAIQ